MKTNTIQNKRYLVKSTYVLVVSLFVFFFPAAAQAEEGGLNFYVTPELPDSQVDESSSYFDLNLTPGQTERLSLTIQNVQSEAIQIQVTPHTAYTNVHGVVEYGQDALDPDPTLQYSLDQLIDPSEVIELAGNETKSISVLLHMPEESFEGFLAGGLRIAEVNEGQDEEASTEEGVAIRNEFAYIVGVVVSNSRASIQPDIDLLDVFADQLNHRNVISATIQNFTPTYVNRLAVEARVYHVGEDEVLYEASEEMMQMAPNSHFDFPIPLAGDRFQSGDYLLKLTAASDNQEWEWEQVFTIEADEARAFNRMDVTIDSSLNWWMIGSIILATLLFVGTLYILIQKKKEKTSKSSKKE